MKVPVLAYLILALAHQLVSQPITEIRQRFHQALLDPSQAPAYHAYMKEIESNDATITAYKAVGEVMMAKEHWNPITKLAHVRNYRERMDEAVEATPEGLEIRFLRFAVEYQLPRFLMMSHHLLDDRDFIVAHMDDVHHLDIDPGYVRYISWFMRHTELLEPEQVASMEESLSSLGDGTQ